MQKNAPIITTYSKESTQLSRFFGLRAYFGQNKRKTIIVLFACVLLYTSLIFIYALTSDFFNDNSKNYLGADKSLLQPFEMNTGSKEYILKEKIVNDQLLRREINVALNKLAELEKKLSTTKLPVPKVRDKRSIQLGSPIKDVKTEKMRNTVKEMMLHAWKGYEKYAWGSNEMRPVSKTSHSSNLFGTSTFGVTIVDSLDTLYIMGLMDEYKRGRDWVHANLTFDVDTEISLFEFNIRFLGGFLTMFAFTGDKMYIDKAVELAKKLESSFATPSGLPRALLHLKSGRSRNYNWASNGCCILSEVGTLHMEFAFLSEITKDMSYYDKVIKIRNLIKSKRSNNGLYYNYLNAQTGDWCQEHASLAGLGDSFYEYLLKEWLRSGDKEALQMYLDTLEPIERYMLRTSSISHLLYLGDYKYGRTQTKMDHLGCFAGGMFAFGAHKVHEVTPNSVGNNTEALVWKKKWIKNGAEITKTCRESYARTTTKLGPEAFHFGDTYEATASNQNERVYILRPETVESYFYMWRLTKDPIYRSWAWDVVQALETHCKVESGGYSGISDVSSYSPAKDDVQQSFFLAETLKYLYLIFSEDDLLPLDSWVFNTEAHPFPVKGKFPVPSL